MKKLIPLCSVLALVACGEKDTREKHIFTVEVEVTDTDGKVQKVKQDCRQLQNTCSASFKLETADGMKEFFVNASNEPTHPGDVMARMHSMQDPSDADKITDSEYVQTTSITAQGFPRFKHVDLKTEKWKNREERILKAELNLPNPELLKKVAELEEKIKVEMAKRWDSDFDKIKALKNEKYELSMPDVKAADLKIRIY